MEKTQAQMEAYRAGAHNILDCFTALALQKPELVASMDAESLVHLCAGLRQHADKTINQSIREMT